MLAYISILQIWLCVGFHQSGTRDCWLYTTSWKTDSVCSEAHHSAKQSAEKTESACFPSHPIQRSGGIAVPMTLNIPLFFGGCLSVLLGCPLGAPAPISSMIPTRLCRIWIRLFIFLIDANLLTLAAKGRLRGCFYKGTGARRDMPSCASLFFIVGSLYWFIGLLN